MTRRARMQLTSLYLILSGTGALTFDGIAMGWCLGWGAGLLYGLWCFPLEITS